MLRVESSEKERSEHEDTSPERSRLRDVAMGTDDTRRLIVRDLQRTHGEGRNPSMGM